MKERYRELCLVLFIGCFSILPATELVPGDIVEVGGMLIQYLFYGAWFIVCMIRFFSLLFHAVGCKVPADLRMVEMLSGQLRVDQAILTGT